MKSILLALVCATLPAYAEDITVKVESGVVHVHGTPGDDQISVRIRQVVVFRQDDTPAYTKFVYDIATPASPTWKVHHTMDVGAAAKAFIIYGGGGNDQINCSQVNERVTPGVRCSIHGNDGDDLIIGANAPSTILGGPGNDTIYSLHDEGRVNGGPGPGEDKIEQIR